MDVKIEKVSIVCSVGDHDFVRWVLVGQAEELRRKLTGRRVACLVHDRAYHKAIEDALLKEEEARRADVARRASKPPCWGCSNFGPPSPFPQFFPVGMDYYPAITLRRWLANLLGHTEKCMEHTRKYRDFKLEVA